MNQLQVQVRNSSSLHYLVLDMVKFSLFFINPNQQLIVAQNLQKKDLKIYYFYLRKLSLIKSDILFSTQH